jgi:hypothetical protein
LLAALGAVAAQAAPARAQTLYGVQGPNARVVEMAGPPASPGCPDGPLKSEFSFAQPPSCPGVAAPVAFLPVGGVPRGDVAVDRVRDVVYVTDGVVIAGYDANGGVVLENFSAAAIGVTPPLTGLGWDGLNDWLWICNANGYGALEPDGSCAPIPRVPFVPRPLGVGFLTDIDRRSETGELWACDVNGVVAHFPPFALAVSNAMTVTGQPALCGALQAPLTGLALNPAKFHPEFIVTDGATVARLQELPGGAAGLADTDFPEPIPCFDAPAGPPLAGLGYACHGLTYGEGNGVTLVVRGQSIVPSATFQLDVTAGPPGSLYVIWGIVPWCPAHKAVGAPLLVGLGTFILGPIPYAGGAAVLAAGLPGNLSQGIFKYCVQVFVQDATGAWVSSNGVEFRASLP